MKSLILTLAALATLGGYEFARAQDAPPPALKKLGLPTIWKTTSVPVGSIFGQIICGPNAKMYFRRESAKQSGYLTPITELNPDGTIVVFDPYQGVGLQGRVILSGFDAGNDDHLYAIANSNADGKSYIIAYDDIGRFDWKAPLSKGVHATFVLPIGQDRFVVSGVLPRKADTEQWISVTAIFDQ